MNKTKRKIFETSMKLFAEKGYDATSIEDITATVGVAKGTLYYHFSSKEEIFNFLVEEGIEKGELSKGDPNVIASGIFGIACSSLIYKMRIDKKIEIEKLYHEIDSIYIKKLKK